MGSRASTGVLSASLMIAMFLVPVASATADDDMEERQAEALAELTAYADWERPSMLSEAQAFDLLLTTAHGDELSPEDAMELIRFVRDNDGTPVFEAVVANLVDTLIEEQLIIAQQNNGLVAPTSDDPWHQSDWNAIAVPLTAAYLAAGTVAPELSPVPHDITIRGIFTPITFAAGCFADGFLSFTCFFRTIADIVVVTDLDAHYTTDTILLQLPLAVELHLHVNCSFFCITTIHLHLLSIAVANDADYVLAYPAGAGEIATRATDNDLLQVVYDALGGLNFQDGHELTAISPVERVPAAYGAIPGGLPGVGDLHAVSPTPNYYGVQTDPAVPPRPPLPATPPQAEVDRAKADYADLDVRNRGSFGTAPLDQTGPTVGFEMTQIRTFTLNIAIVRWKNIGTSAATLPEAPATFYYNAAGYFTGASGDVYAVNIPLTHGLV